MNDTTYQGDGKIAFVPVVVNAKQHPKTNADCIRAMTDEELAIICEYGCPPPHECPPIKEEEMGLRSVCQKCWLDWLKAPADKEVDNG